MSTTTSYRPFGVTILAILAGIAGVLAVVHFFQALAILPYFIGPFAVILFYCRLPGVRSAFGRDQSIFAQQNRRQA